MQTLLNELNMQVTNENIKSVMLKAAEAAAKEILPLFRSNCNVENKFSTGFDPVTIADKNSEKVIREIIGDAFPEHSILGEELADKNTNSEYVWIIDPIDGTRSFISGLPVWGILIGLLKNGKAIAGLNSQPYIGETYIAVGNSAEFIFKGEVSALKVSETKNLDEAIMFTTTPELFSNKAQKAAFANVEKQVRLSRYGVDCYAYSLLALGQIDLVIEPELKQYDIAPLIAIVEKAGGIISTWEGKGAENGGNVVAAATPELHRAALAIMQGCS